MPLQMTKTTVRNTKTASSRTVPSADSIRTFRSAVNYLNSLVNYERVPHAKYTLGNFGLARCTRLLAALGNPHRSFKSIHIAGTKGKGSTASMVAAMVRSTGQKVGLYTSPHVLDIRERIAINGTVIPESAFARAVASVAAIATKAKVPTPTYFEVLTAAAFSYFHANDVDVAVVEVGMGGRLDSTNVITPELVGITSISVDHTAQLGKDLKSIAKEKAGIFKKGVPIVSAPQPPAVRTVLEEAAEAIGAPIRFSTESVDFSYRFEFSRSAGRHARICLTTPTSRFEHVRVPLLGAHQAANCALALNLIDAAKTRGFDIDDQSAMDGLNQVSLLGRMQLISEEPNIIVDGAHNAASIDALMRGVGQHVPYDSMIVVFGCQKDKDIPGMLARLQIGADKMIFTGTSSPRSADPYELAAQYTELSGKMAQVGKRLPDAMAIATSAITHEDLICVTGSFYLVAEGIRKLSKASS